MEDVLLLEKQSITERNVRAYFKTHDVRYVAKDAVFKQMFTGEVHQGREAIQGLLNFFYKVAFDARAEPTNVIITETHAVEEVNFVGKHIGDLPGLPATHKNVRVPFTVVFDLQDGLIKEARVYFPMDILMRQLS